MVRPVISIRNIGPAMAEALARIGVDTAEDLHALGTDAAYARLLANGMRPHFISYYVIEMGLQGRPWNDCRGAEKDALRLRFDALKAENAPADRSALEAELNRIGVIAPKR